MFGWAKFVGLRFWISRFSCFRKGNFLLRFRYHAIFKSWFRQNFLLKTKNSLWLYRCVSSALPSPYISLVLCLNESASQGLVLSSTFLLCSVYRRSSSQFQVNILHDPSLNLWYRFGLFAICWFTLFELKILEFRDLLLLLLLERAISVSQIALHCCTIWNLYLPSCKRCLKDWNFFNWFMLLSYTKIKDLLKILKHRNEHTVFPLYSCCLASWFLIY